ncbi:Tumor necrosis factor, alpha-induced protein 3 [Desmophyllum pertusum]|uniref:ubiquitinyl hydrolase 1 n=1 Tax=Desmophyllum pertusum TaxID=174260 RepID=A0A9W9ZBQ9_9CNID|nr:Tumor necrosis factor, alpha-induced protein 3 [Desmophyllum pertusum]
MAFFQPPSHLFERNISLNDLDSLWTCERSYAKMLSCQRTPLNTAISSLPPSIHLCCLRFKISPSSSENSCTSFLVDGHILRELETARRLNWSSSLCRMVTVNTLGDGNCLMHAASIGMWAVNDRYQILRKTVYEALLEDVEGTRFYHRRWKSEEQQQILNQIGGYQRTEEQWNHEWEEVIRHISQTEFPFGPNGAQFGSLEEIHIFVLANILRRTIIVLSEETLRGAYGDSYSPINFGGIYLPLLWDSVDCVKSPLVIGYSNGHFTAVVSIEDGKLDLGIENQPAPSSTNCTHAVPLVKYDGMQLPVHFLHDHEVPLASDRLRQYLDCAKVPFSSNPGETRQAVLVAKLNFSEQPRCMKDLIDGYFMKAREEHQRVARHSQLHPQNPPGTKQPALQIVPCQTQGCSFYGSTETGNRCSQCLNEYLRTLGPACEPSRHVAIGQIPSRQQHVVATAQQLQAQNASMSQQHTVTSTQPPSNAGMVSSSLTLPAASSVKCRTTECKYGAMTGRGGLCERCFEAERSAEEMAASMNYMNLASTKHCSNKVNGCEFFGLPEHHNLCSRCYRTFCLHMEKHFGNAVSNWITTK